MLHHYIQMQQNLQIKYHCIHMLQNHKKYNETSEWKTIYIEFQSSCFTCSQTSVDLSVKSQI